MASSRNIKAEEESPIYLVSSIKEPDFGTVGYRPKVEEKTEEDVDTDTDNILKDLEEQATQTYQRESLTRQESWGKLPKQFAENEIEKEIRQSIIKKADGWIKKLMRLDNVSDIDYIFAGSYDTIKGHLWDDKIDKNLWIDFDGMVREKCGMIGGEFKSVGESIAGFKAAGESWLNKNLMVDELEKALKDELSNLKGRLGVNNPTWELVESGCKIVEKLLLEKADFKDNSNNIQAKKEILVDVTKILETFRAEIEAEFKQNIYFAEEDLNGICKKKCDKIMASYPAEHHEEIKKGCKELEAQFQLLNNEIVANEIKIGKKVVKKIKACFKLEMEAVLTRPHPSKILNNISSKLLALSVNNYRDTLGLSMRDKCHQKLAEQECELTEILETIRSEYFSEEQEGKIMRGTRERRPLARAKAKPLETKTVRKSLRDPTNDK